MLGDVLGRKAVPSLSPPRAAPPWLAALHPPCVAGS